MNGIFSRLALLVVAAGSLLSGCHRYRYGYGYQQRVYVTPRPAYYYQRPVYVAPQPTVYVAPAPQRVYVAPQPVYVAPAAPSGTVYVR